jgi:hypothetical protein
MFKEVGHASSCATPTYPWDAGAGGHPMPDCWNRTLQTPVLNLIRPENTMKILIGMK